MPSLFLRIINGVKSLLLSQVLYLDKQCYQFNAQSELALATNTGRRIIVLSRHCYTEQVQWLPVSRKSEAKKLAKFQQRVKGSNSYFVLGRPLNGKIPVTWYQLKESVSHYNALLFLPETLLLARRCGAEEVLIYQSPDHKIDIFVTSTHAGAVSSIKGGILQSPAQFMLSQGSGLQQFTQLTPEQLSDYLKSELVDFYHLPLAGLINAVAFKRNASVSALSRYVWPLAASLTLYLMVAGVFSAYLQQHSREQLQQDSRVANQLLLKREEIENMAARFEQLQQVLPASGNLLQLWHVLAPLYEQQVIVSNVQQKMSDVTLRIESPSATAALQLLVQRPDVINAKVEGNVRRQNNKDVATVSFQLRQEAL
jgi:hypothetical protein